MVSIWRNQRYLSCSLNICLFFLFSMSVSQNLCLPLDRSKDLPLIFSGKMEISLPLERALGSVAFYARHLLEGPTCNSKSSHPGRGPAGHRSGAQESSNLLHTLKEKRFKSPQPVLSLESLCILLLTLNDSRTSVLYLSVNIRDPLDIDPHLMKCDNEFPLKRRDLRCWKLKIFE